MSNDVDRVPLGDRLSKSPERQAGMAWPIALHHRLDDLLGVLDEAGENTSRKEIVAALLLAAPTSPQKLESVLRTYRRALVREAIVNPPTGDNVIELPRQGPGRRSRIRRVEKEGKRAGS